ncbi:alpha/beta hydrolase family protein [Streptomyces sp. NPDC093225]|uniref:alpha/beta hydrolase family protein n=1 Tax=Streptomyces sp. NPDC093225 TaxID=3366034 RepID=UPI00380CC4EE
MIRVTRVVTAAAAVVALAAATPGLAHALPAAGSAPAATGGSSDGRLPAGWEFTGAGDGRQLVWTSRERVPMGDARVEFYAGDRLVGRPAADPDGRTFRLRLDGARVGDPADLRVLAGGRRLDAAAPVPGGQSQSLPGLEAAARAERLPANPVDPGVPGHYRTAKGEYALPGVRLPGFKAPVEMRGVVVGPVDAPGKRPVALFLHGRHGTCYKPGGGENDVTGDWPCKPGTLPIPSHLGYLKDQQLLASQGYVTVSISANGINGQDWAAEDGGAQARSSLVRLHLAHWADWAAKRSTAPAAVRATDPADLSRVMLVGHSRGGEGVNRAAMDSLYTPPADQDGYHGKVRWTIRGNVLIGPTIFGQNPVPDVPSMTILPGCDGDVSDLQGQIVADGTRGISRGTALHSSVYVVGANHNFFNSEWTPGLAKAPAQDDFFSDQGAVDPVCSPGKKPRLTAAQQHTAGAAYVAAAARLFVAGDDTVRPLLDGTGRRAPSAGPARVLTSAVGGNRSPFVVPGPDRTTVSGTGVRLCGQTDPNASRACLRRDKPGQSPHFAGWEAGPEPERQAVALKWTAPGAAAIVRPSRPASLAAAEDLALRLFVPPNTSGTRLDVAVTDAAGKRADLGRITVDGLPGSDRTSSYWAKEVRVPLTAAKRAGLDLKNIASLRLTPRSRAGQAWLMDAWGWRPGTPQVLPAPLPRVDIGRLTVKEGDSGVRTYRVPVTVTGPARSAGRVRYYVPTADGNGFTGKTVAVRPGTRTIDVKVDVRGNERWGHGFSRDLVVKALSGAVVGSHRGGVTAENDDPMPTVKVTPVADKVTEGKALTWRVTLSEAADEQIYSQFELLPVTRGAELSTMDVDKAWLKGFWGDVQSPERPLSKVVDGASVPVEITPGKTSVDITIPTAKDGKAESAELVRGRLAWYDENWQPHYAPTVTGTVRDAS